MHAFIHSVIHSLTEEQLPDTVTRIPGPVKSMLQFQILLKVKKGIKIDKLLVMNDIGPIDEIVKKHLWWDL